MRANISMETIVGCIESGNDCRSFMGEEPCTECPMQAECDEAFKLLVGKDPLDGNQEVPGDKIEAWREAKIKAAQKHFLNKHMEETLRC